jgi:hypothetical protein
VVQIPPKSLTRLYKKHHYKVTFIPATKKWKWSVEVVMRTIYSEEADTQIKAFKAAERRIDQMLRAQGKD